MQYKIEYSSLAYKSLNEIFDYIADILLEPKTAQNIVLGIMSTINSLSELPKRHKLCDEDFLKNKNIRSTHFKNYKILYFIDDNSFTVTIVNIFYSKRNINNVII
jgi:plasmid stabilization system protein ParE